MANTFKTPGVYIQEISKLPASVAPVETAIPAFIGYVQTTEKDGDADALLNEPTRVTSLLEFESIFGGPKLETPTITITDTYNDNDDLVDRSITTTFASISDYKLYYHLQMFFANGGGPCYIVATGTYSDAVDAGELTTGLNALEKADEPTLLVFPDHLSTATYKSVYDAALAHCNKLQDRFTIMDIKTETGDTVVDAGEFRNNGIGPDNLKYGSVYYPYIKSALNYGADENVQVTHNNTGGSSGGASTGDLPANGDLHDLYLDQGLVVPDPTDIVYANPSVYRSIIAKMNEKFVTLAPSGTMAGIYARVDNDRGVWKAPANVGVRLASGPSFKITNEDQENLNVDATSGKSINVIRTFAGKGTLVWGARTLAGNDNEWRYVPVRRLFIFVEESVKKATEFVVFEPNDANTWLRVKTMIENFLTGLWKDGALAGATPGEAFFVNVGLGLTMTPQDILEGRLNVEIGMAAVRPAEFIILKFSHKLQES